jgi:hypothetical protein
MMPPGSNPGRTGHLPDAGPSEVCPGGEHLHPEHLRDGADEVVAVAAAEGCGRAAARAVQPEPDVVPWQQRGE